MCDYPFRPSRPSRPVLVTVAAFGHRRLDD